MISLPVPRILLLGLAGGLLFQSLREAEAAPSFRPALIGNGPKSLVNLIDTQKLLAKGQGDGVVMFDVAIDADDGGSVNWIWCHAAPGSEILKEEVTKALRRASFIPALINGKEVGVAFYGTVIFVVRDGRPFLRVFANQDRTALAQQNDLIQPQMLLDSEDWEGAKPLLEVVKMHTRTGHAIISVTVDQSGKVRDLHLVREEPTAVEHRRRGLESLRDGKIHSWFPRWKAGQLHLRTRLGRARFSLPKMMTNRLRLLASTTAIAFSLGWNGPGLAADNPSFRPGLVGSGPKSLVNLIDVSRLLREGQGDGMVMFTAFPSGDRVFKGAAAVYNGTPGTKVLEKEVRRALDKAVMTPAIAGHKLVLVAFDGTVMFFRGATPHLRVLANQDPKELAHFSDFIAPQLIFGSTTWDPKASGLEAARRLGKNGAVVLSLHVDQEGRLLDSRLVSESPAGLNFGPLILKSFATAKFVPAFRNGKPVECTFQRTEYVQTRP